MRPGSHAVSLRLSALHAGYPHGRPRSHFDLALLDVLQRFGRATHQQLGEEVPLLSPSQIGRRLQHHLEATGVIDGYRVVLRPEKLGLGVTAFTSLKLKHHGDTVIDQFQQQIEALPEVLECHATVGDAD